MKEPGFFLSSPNRFLSNWLAFPIPACKVLNKVLIYQSSTNSPVYPLVVCCLTENSEKILGVPVMLECNVSCVWLCVLQMTLSTLELLNYIA